MTVALFPTKRAIKIGKKPITKKHLRAIMPCTLERAKEVFIDPRLDVESRRYIRLENRLIRIWFTLKRVA